MIRGGIGYDFFPCANFLFCSEPETNIFSFSGKGTRNSPPPHVTHFSASFVNKPFIFLQVAEQTIFYHFLLNNLFLSNTPP